VFPGLCHSCILLTRNLEPVPCLGSAGAPYDLSGVARASCSLLSVNPCVAEGWLSLGSFDLIPVVQCSSLCFLRIHAYKFAFLQTIIVSILILNLKAIRPVLVEIEKLRFHGFGCKSGGRLPGVVACPGTCYVTHRFHLHRT
jgi:hypothetical protein